MFYSLVLSNVLEKWIPTVVTSVPFQASSLFLGCTLPPPPRQQDFLLPCSPLQLFPQQHHFLLFCLFPTEYMLAWPTARLPCCRGCPDNPILVGCVVARDKLSFQVCFNPSLLNSRCTEDQVIYSCILVLNVKRSVSVGGALWVHTCSVSMRT